MNGGEFKDMVFKLFAMIAQSFSSPRRLEIIDVLIQGERDVETLSREVNMSIANTSKHLQVLKNARLLESRKEGVRVLYRVADDSVFACWKNLQNLAEQRLYEMKEIVRMYYQDRDKMEPVSRDNLLGRLKLGDVLVLDVRPFEEYRSGHISKALSIPLPELKQRIDEIPKNMEIVAYCRGPYCVLAAEAITFLRKAGIKAIRMKDGFPEWKNAGLPVEHS
ncbi:MAG TPA: metalloregulator ArsR/SmtB family transcription factor [Spirochaetes bacterium]|nr:metalloregulator ArsR/SmtB family transcription factor [Spirochaetota bacterium]